MKSIETIKTFAENIQLPEDMQKNALPLCLMIIDNYACEYAEIQNDLENVKLIHSLADKMQKEQDAVVLAVSLMLGADASDFYESKGMERTVYMDSMREITIWAKTCLKMRGHIGLYEYGWVRNFFRASIVRLHRLEFHQISFPKDLAWSCDGVEVSGGDTVINIHIPEDGALKHDDVIESLRRAYRYFGCSGKQTFVCDSWLLYPGNYEFLSEKSNIRKFMDCFDIIRRKDVKYSGDLWRIFGPCVSYDDVGKFPRETELQRAMIKYLEEHDFTTGSGFGVFLFDGEKIIK